MNSPLMKQRRNVSGRTAALAVAGLFCLGVMLAQARPTETNATTQASTKPAAKKLTGAELYAINCNRCHAERYPTEWTPAQWQTLMTHMRVRASLPAKQAREILKYLKEEAGAN